MSVSLLHIYKMQVDMESTIHKISQKSKNCLPKLRNHDNDVEKEYFSHSFRCASAPVGRATTRSHTEEKVQKNRIILDSSMVKYAAVNCAVVGSSPIREV